MAFPRSGLRLPACAALACALSFSLAATAETPAAPTAAEASGARKAEAAPAPAPAAAGVTAPAAGAPGSAPSSASTSTPQAAAPSRLAGNGRADVGNPDDFTETPIPIPPPVPVGFLIAWKPTILSVRVDDGSGSRFGSDKFQPLRLLVRYTHLFQDLSPFVGRLEAEGGQFQTDTERTNIGSDGADFTLRATVGSSTKVSSFFNVLGSIGAITRYQWGRPTGGAPTIGVLGAVANSEFEFRVLPSCTLILFGEVALTSVPYFAQANLGELSDASEIKARLQLSFDITRNVSTDVGFEFTRWHSAFTQSTILGNANPTQALLIEDREFQLTLGVRFKR
ncbi:MAG: hypothetical protein JST92_20030 [Deltaproteobacteria bacterium]|nr:hypothetical protein [Deltaproteobacteria bacterium]